MHGTLWGKLEADENIVVNKWAQPSLFRCLCLIKGCGILIEYHTILATFHLR